ncbi:type II secretion system protein GspM [Dickeya zeae]|uniref:Type II secretion system protein M n=1 Tax=Dickeya zeae TaxID=204042 RepID=A0AAE6YZC2_9GAMM|nr:type II secretion system protein M [Dickeya zeae]MCO7260499.1 type II secretion system protein M [Dickeya zeae]QIZ50550.1 type II secretion system protein M [Dickeya zeae]QYM94191.1 type II secretion system protein M [Dickeya zeae]
MNELRRRWQIMSQRERMMMLACGGLVVLCLLYYLLWSPWQESARQWQMTIDRERQTARWMQQQAPRLPPPEGARRQIAGRDISLTVLVPQSAARFGITVLRMQPQESQVSVTLARSDFNNLLHWLAELEQKNGVITQGMDVTAVPNSPGIVEVTRLSLERVL